MIFAISDTHFCHANIIKYCNRPFKDVNEMNDVIVNNWNLIVSSNDIVIHFGDFCLGTKDNINYFTNKLNGNKIIILGNHDRNIKTYLESGFVRVYKHPIYINNFILSHKPMPTNNTINIHGHIHNSLLNIEEFDINTHINISCDVTGFKPVTFKSILGSQYNEEDIIKAIM